MPAYQRGLAGFNVKKITEFNLFDKQNFYFYKDSVMLLVTDSKNTRVADTRHKTPPDLPILQNEVYVSMYTDTLLLIILPTEL